MKLPSYHSSFTRLKKKSADFVLLFVNAIAAIAFTSLGGFLVYTNTQHLIETRKWLNHSQVVLTNLQRESQNLDEVSYGLRRYNVDGNLTMLRDSASALGALRVGAEDLETLVQDNASQVRHTQQIFAELSDIERALQPAGKSTTVPDDAIRRCRTTIRLMQTEEQNLLNERLNESKEAGRDSLIVGIGYLGFSLIIVVSLFAFLVRDAMRRRRFQRELSRSNEKLEFTVARLKERETEAHLSKQARDELQLCVSPSEAQDCAARHLAMLVPGSNGAILLLDNARQMLQVVAEWNEPHVLDGGDPGGCCGLRSGRSRWRTGARSELHCTHFVGTSPQDYLCAPLIALGETLGVVFLGFPTEEVLTLAEQRNALLLEMTELVAMALAGLKLRSKLESQSIRDGLTNLFNRTFMEIALDRELQMAGRRKSSLAVLMLDIDDFKVFNDTYGHQAGDEVLRQVAKAFTESVRIEDIVCRYGGEEFVILLPDISETLALERAETIRRNVGCLPAEFRGRTLEQVSVSIGVAMYPNPAKDALDLLRLADSALYEAKQGGRNQTKVAAKVATLSADQAMTESSQDLLTFSS